MTAHIPRLARGEWRKIRRRRMPWVLLGLVVLVSQILTWSFYVVYHIGDQPLGAPIEPFEYSGSEGSIVVTCQDVVEQRADAKLEAVTGTLAPEEFERVGTQAAEWSETCEGYRTPDEARSEFTLPYSITNIATAPLVFFIMPILVLAASAVGMEYGWGTLRTTLTRGVGRWQLLSGKLVMLAGAGIAGTVVVGVLVGVASLLAGVVPPGEAGSLVAGGAGAWLDAIAATAKLAFALVPYIALGVFFAVLTRSTATGTSLSMGYYIGEPILPLIFGVLSDRLGDVVQVALLSENTGEWLTTVTSSEAQKALGTAAEQPDTLRAFLVLAAYTAALVAAALWVFQRRDVTGPRGE